MHELLIVLAFVAMVTFPALVASSPKADGKQDM